MSLWGFKNVEEDGQEEEMIPSSNGSASGGSTGSPVGTNSMPQLFGRIIYTRKKPVGAQPPLKDYSLSLLDETFAGIRIYAGDDNFNYYPSSTESWKYPRLQDHGLGEYSVAPSSSVAQEAALAFSSYPALNHSYSSALGHQAQPESFHQGNRWRSWDQGLSFPAGTRLCRKPYCFMCNDFFTLATTPKTSLGLQDSIRTMNVAQINQMFYKLCSEDNLHRFCFHTHGRKVVQRLLERITEPRQKYLLMETLKPKILELIKHEEGRYVIESCLMNFTDEENKLILGEVALNCCDIGTDIKGYHVLIHIIKYFSHWNHESIVLNEMAENALTLAYDPFGNYLVQSMLDKGIMHFSQIILSQLTGHFHDLSTDKYGSNVVQKCLMVAPLLGLGRLETMISELLSRRDTSSLFLHEYGNYVMQTALKASQVWRSSCHRDLLDELRMNAPMVRSTKFAKQLLRWLPRRSVPFYHCWF